MAAEWVCRSSFDIREVVLGREHTDTLASINILGSGPQHSWAGVEEAGKVRGGRIVASASAGKGMKRCLGKRTPTRSSVYTIWPPTLFKRSVTLLHLSCICQHMKDTSKVLGAKHSTTEACLNHYEP